jgi:hypothetical protein
MTIGFAERPTAEPGLDAVWSGLKLMIRKELR